MSAPVHVVRHHHVRADADSLFVPAEDLTDANVGDAVRVVDEGTGTSRTGHVESWVDDPARGRHAVLHLNPGG